MFVSVHFNIILTSSPMSPSLFATAVLYTFLIPFVLCRGLDVITFSLNTPDGHVTVSILLLTFSVLDPYVPNLLTYLLTYSMEQSPS